MPSFTVRARFQRRAVVPAKAGIQRRPRRPGETLLPDGPDNSASKVIQELRLGEALIRMAEAGVPRAAAIEFMVPGNGMVGAHLAPCVRPLVQSCQNVHAGRSRGEIVPFVRSIPDLGEAACRQV